MDKFDRAEVIGRYKAATALKAINPDLEIHSTPISAKCVYDLWFWSGDSIVAVECKDRDNTIDKYPDYLLSAPKYDNLRALSAHTTQIWYCNTFTDGKALFWNVLTAPTTKGIRRHHKTTVVDSPMIEEEVVYFKKEDAIYGQ